MSKNEDNAAEPKKWGKGKTDPATWWKKGCKSPNPNGRPKGSKNQKTMYLEAFGQKALVSLDGKSKSLPYREIGYHQLARKSGAGELASAVVV